MIEDTVHLFQTKYRSRNGHDQDDTESVDLVTVGPCILPSNWRKRVDKPGSVYEYNKTEVLEYNETVYMHGEQRAKAWADRRWHERTKRNA